jgi:hypothetical protein
VRPEADDVPRRQAKTSRPKGNQIFNHVVRHNENGHREKASCKLHRVGKKRAPQDVMSNDLNALKMLSRTKNRQSLWEHGLDLSKGGIHPKRQIQVSKKGSAHISRYHCPVLRSCAGATTLAASSS